MPAGANPTTTITIWVNDHKEFAEFCKERAWKQPGMFRAMLECWKANLRAIGKIEVSGGTVVAQPTEQGPDQ